MPENTEGREAPGAGAILLVLILANLLSYFDRQFLLVAAVPLQQDLGLSDTQIGALGGFSFALCYAVFGLPISVLVDRYDRMAIVAASILVWSAGTLACGLASGFPQLFAARMLVGIGEAGLAPAAYSLIGSCFAVSGVPRASGFYAVGAALGTGLAIVAGGMLIGWLATVPLPAGWHGWQLAFLLLAMLGLPLALTALGIGRRMPARPSPATPTASAPVGGMPAYVWRHRALYLPLLATACLYMAFLSGFLAWSPAFFTRRFGWSLAETGALFGSVFLLFNVLSGPLGGWIASRLSRRSGQDRTLDVCLACIALLLVVATLGPLMRSAPLAVLLLGCAPLFSGMVGALVPAMIVIVTPPELRGRVIALFLFCMMALGYGAGPLLFGWFTEHVLGDRAALHLSLAILSPALLVPTLIALHRVRTVMRAAQS